MRNVVIVLATLTCVLIAFTMLATNSNKDLVRYTGRWKGEFAVESITKGEDTEEARTRNRLGGYLQVYLTGHKYKIHLEGLQQGIDIEGTWKAQGDRLTLTPKAITIDDQGGAEKRDPNKPYIANESVMEAYNRPMTLSQSSDKKKFQGLKMTIGDLLGEHRFVKDGA